MNMHVVEESPASRGMKVNDVAKSNGLRYGRRQLWRKESRHENGGGFAKNQGIYID